MNSPFSNPQRALWCSIIGGISAIAITILLRSIFDTRLLAEVILDATTDGSSPQNFNFLLRTLESLARPLLFVSVTLAQLAIYVAVWRRTEAIRTSIGGVPAREITAFAASSAILISGTALLGVLFDTPLGSNTPWIEYIAVTLVAAAAFVVITRGLESWDASMSGAPVDASRRLLLSKGPAIAIGAIALYVVGDQVLLTKKGGTQQGAHPGEPTSEITPNEDFYLVSKNLIDPPKVDIDSWRLQVRGLVPQPLDLDIVAIRAMPVTELYATFQCISNEVGGYLTGTALWKGVLLTDFFAAVKPSANARHLWFESTDDYTENLPIDFANMDGVMLAYEMNGEVLPQSHGFPLRLVAPGKYGMKQPKWIREITFRDQEEDGYWSRRGWDTEADMQTSSRIDVPRDGDNITSRTLRIEGMAFSGRRGIQRVEISMDDGKTWAEATLRPPLSRYTWTLWHYDWDDIQTGGERIRLTARATDGAGATQTSKKEFPFPKGASGYPTLDVFT